jgi:tetratricopeptide (TPR) repeat protein
VSVCGLGGIGKTQIVLEYIYRLIKRSPQCAVFWVPAISTETFDNAYQQIAHILNLPISTDSQIDVKESVREKLSDENFGEWLLVIDNADDIDILLAKSRTGSNGKRYIDYLPNNSEGSIIFTTRTRKAAQTQSQGNFVEIGQLNQIEALRVLGQSLSEKPNLDGDRHATELLHLLAYLPIAIVQAADYMNKNSCPVFEYISLFKESEQNGIELLSEEFEDPGRYNNVQKGGSNNAVATTWLISFERIQQQDKIAVEYLSFMACLERDNIPLSLLPRSPEISGPQQKSAIGTLKAYSFIAQMDDQLSSDLEKTFSMHRLVHMVTRNWLRRDGQLSIWADTALKTLLETIPWPDYENRLEWPIYLPHAILVANTKSLSHETTELKIDLLENVAEYYYIVGAGRNSEGAHRQILQLKQKLFGMEDPDTLQTMGKLGQSLEDQGKYVESEVMQRELLLLTERILGTEHPHTLGAMNDLAGALGKQGKHVEAEEIHRKALLLKEKIFGKEHVQTLTSLNELALALTQQGKYVETEEIWREILLLQDKVSGKDHPRRLVHMNNLAVAIRLQGRNAEAELMLREVLPVSEKVMGKEHPDTLVKMENLAGALRSQGKLVEAESIQREVWQLREKVLGKEHPDTLKSTGHLAGLLSAQKKYIEAEVLYRLTWEFMRRVLGETHPDSLTSISNLAVMLRHQKKYVEEEIVRRSILALRRESLGEEHSKTLKSMDSLAMVLRDLAKYVEAEEVHKSVLEIRRRTLGEDHPHTESTMTGLVLLFRDQGKYEDEEAVCRSIIELRERTLGKEHPSTLHSIAVLASILRAQGKYAEVEALQSQPET